MCSLLQSGDGGVDLARDPLRYNTNETTSYSSFLSIKCIHCPFCI